MTEAEVLAVVGLAPGDCFPQAAPGLKAVEDVEGWGLRTKDRRRVNDPTPDVNDGLMQRVWFGRTHILEVVLDADRKAVGCHLVKYYRERRSFLPD
jgi:hypothetical protein